MTNIKALEDLRVYANGWRNGFGGHPSDVETLADRIEREVSQRFIPLPCDEDGVLIHVGDVVQGLGDAGPVQHIELWDDGWVVVFEFAPGQFTRYSGDAVRHVKPRTVEDVLADFANEVARQGHQIGLTGRELAMRYADEIRELMGVKE